MVFDCGIKGPWPDQRSPWYRKCETPLEQTPDLPVLYAFDILKEVRMPEILYSPSSMPLYVEILLSNSLLGIRSIVDI
jgi:hypothetical protein